MSRLTDLLAQARAYDPRMAQELEREIRHATNQRSFGLVFERHLPDGVELPTRPVRRGDTVHILPPRGTVAPTDPTLWKVVTIDRKAEGGATATVIEAEPGQGNEPELRDGVKVDDLVVVAQHDDIIYPGLVQTGEVVNSDDPEAPFHTVINAENLHALNLLTYTHRHKVDCIYIDPPYNTRDKDWKYNNDYVDGDDQYKHSKWLSMMEKRLELAKELLNPEDSVLIVTIDEKEYLRLGMLLEQTFPEARIQKVSSVISSKGSARAGEFSRSDEFIYFVMFGEAAPQHWRDDMLTQIRADEDDSLVEQVEVEWGRLKRNGKNGRRARSKSGFYPIFLDTVDGTFHSVGQPLPVTGDWRSVREPEGTTAIWPIQARGEEQSSGISASKIPEYVEKGFIKFGKVFPEKESQKAMVYYLTDGYIDQAARGEIENIGTSSKPRWVHHASKLKRPFTVWYRSAHDAGWHGTRLLDRFIPNRDFDYAKSLYAVEDTIRFFVAEKPNATILDFFSGSGTTAHAVMRLNKQDGGRRRSILVTNNEVSFEEAKQLAKAGHRPGDPEWEKLGICDYVTMPRIEAAITGKTPTGDPIKGDYKFTDEFPMADGFEANARFFTLTYEPPTRVRHGLAYKQIAPLLWMKADQFGRVIESIPDRGWDVAESHGVIENLAAVESFADAIRETGTVTTAYIVTDDDLAFQSTVSRLDGLDVECVQLYSTYLTNFAFTQSGGAI